MIAEDRQLGASRTSPIQVVVDRPFIFLVRDAKTGSVLFLGRGDGPEGMTGGLRVSGS